MLIDSKNAIIEALKKNIVKKLIVKDGEGLSDYLKYRNIEVEKIDSLDFKKKYSEFKSGVLALVDYEYIDLYDILNREKRIVLLDHIQDPHNFGAVVRAAHQFGFNSIVIAKDRQVEVTNAVIRASVGTIFHMKICSAVNLSRVIDLLKKNNYFVYATDVKAKKNLENITLSDKFVIVLGSEGYGIRRNLLKKSDESFKIETYGLIDSLNVSQSAAIIFYVINKMLK